MSRQAALEQYTEALKQGQKEYKDCIAKGIDAHPAVLDMILDKQVLDYATYVGVVEIPVEKIIGTKSEGRVSAFSRSFLPLLKPDTEFAAKWISLCADHLGDTGIREPIKCYEYMGKFYIQEGNKRLSILKFLGSPRITGEVYRILPPKKADPENTAYYEFLDFYDNTKLYDVLYRHPGCFAKLCGYVGIPAGQPWTEDQRRKFRAGFHRFRDCFLAAGGAKLHMLPEDAFLVWIQVYGYEALEDMTDAQLKKSVTNMWENLQTIDIPDPIVRTEAPATESKSMFSLLKHTGHIKVAFVHQGSCESSPWTHAHDIGRQHMEAVLGKAVSVHSYFDANTAEQAEAILEQAVAEGAQVIFTTTPKLIGPCLKVSIRYPKVRFFNCSVHMPYSTVHTYYCRVYEGKFITGAIAGAIAANSGCNRIGYVGSYPIFGVPASINAFALGAQMTNPQAQIVLKWSCLPGNPTQEFLDEGIRVISNRDAPVNGQIRTEFGTYLHKEDGTVDFLGSPCWLWGNFYENVIRSILAGTWDTEHADKAVNDWWGIRSGVVNVELSDALPQGLANLANILLEGLKNGTIDPFLRQIHAQDGSLKNDGSRAFSTDELLHMDWLCSNVIGSIPGYSDVLPFSQPTVRLLGIHREDIPDIKEVNL